MLFDILHDAPDQQRDLISRLPAVLHLLQGDPEHSGSAEGVVEGSREALPHRLHSLAASVRLQTETSKARSRRPPGSTPPSTNTLWVGWQLKRQTPNKTTKQAGNCNRTSPIFGSCGSYHMRCGAYISEVTVMCADQTVVRCGTMILRIADGRAYLKKMTSSPSQTQDRYGHYQLVRTSC